VGPALRLRSGHPEPRRGVRRDKASQPAGKPNSVSPPSRLAALRREDNHSSRPAIARRLERPTRWHETGRPSGLRQRHPIWPCSVRGFACHRRYRRRGALLPHLFTLTHRSPKGEGGRYVFCATVRQVALPGRYPAHCPAEFGLSSRLRPSGFGGQAREGRLPKSGYEDRRLSG
jgi:hypothetical protein